MEIDAEKQGLVKQGKIKDPKPLPLVSPEEMTYSPPKGWEWVRLGEIGAWKSGTTPSRTNPYYYGGSIPWVKSGEVKQGRVKSTEETITAAALSECSLHINPVGSVLIAMYGANIGEVGILEIEATTNQAVCACQAFSGIDKNFLLTVLRSLKTDFISQGAGAAQPNISREKIITTIAPLPPAAEQIRIVAKINELMARCDALEKLRAEREAKRLAVHTAAVRQLLNVADTDVHIQAREFLGQHFGELYTVKENVTELRKAILQLAVMGKLVPQDPKDFPASELLKQIETEKKKLVMDGKLRETKNLIAARGELNGATLPQGWTWTQLQNLVAIVTDGDHQPPPKADRGVPFLVIGNLNRMAIDFADCRFVSSEYYDALDWSRRPKRRDVLYTVTGSYGIPIVVDRDEEFCVQRHVAIFKSAPSTPVEYLSWVLRSETSVNYATTIATGIAQKTVPLTGLRAMPIPLPPLPEQRRIVAKIDQLMSICNTLEHQIEAARNKQSAMLNAMMAQYKGHRCA